MESEQFEILLDHYDHPRNHGHLDEPDYSSEEGNPVCGDIISFDLKVEDNHISDVAFSGEGCVISQATGSILSELIQNKSLDEIREMDAGDIFSTLGINISPIRYKCALLSLKVLKSALFGTKDWPEVPGD